MNFKSITLSVFGLMLGAASMKAIPYSPEYLQANAAEGGNLQYISYGNFDKWLVRHVKESGVIGGETKTLYCIAPNGTWNNNNAYHGAGGSPWATSNVMAKVSGTQTQL